MEADSKNAQSNSAPQQKSQSQAKVWPIDAGAKAVGGIVQTPSFNPAPQPQPSATPSQPAAAFGSEGEAPAKRKRKRTRKRKPAGEGSTPPPIAQL